jgi:hypothetical protein
VSLRCGKASVSQLADEPQSWRGFSPRSRLAAPCIADAVAGVSAIASELGDALDALDVRPLIRGPVGVMAVDALALSCGGGSG